MKTKCRAKDPNTCRNHSDHTTQVLQQHADNAVAAGNADDYLTARSEQDKKESPVQLAPEKQEIPKEAIEAAVKARWGRTDEYTYISEYAKENRIAIERAALSEALTHMPNGVITEEAVESMAIAHSASAYPFRPSEEGAWERTSEVSKEGYRKQARKILEDAAPHMGISLNGKAAIRNMFLRMENKAFNTADSIVKSKENLEEKAAAGVERIADRHEGGIPTDVGGGTMLWSDLNPFKNPFKNGKLR